MRGGGTTWLNVQTVGQVASGSPREVTGRHDKPFKGELIRDFDVRYILDILICHISWLHTLATKLPHKHNKNKFLFQLTEASCTLFNVATMFVMSWRDRRGAYMCYPVLCFTIMFILSLWDHNDWETFLFQISVLFEVKWLASCSKVLELSQILFYF